MSRHLERLLQIDALLRSGIRQTHRSLAVATEVSDRTIRNDLAFLRDRLLAPLEYQKERGWHYSDQNWRLPSISLSQGELFALTLGARMLEAYAGSAYVEELRSAIARLSERLPEATWIDLQQVADERILFRAGASINLDPEIWHDLERACKKSKSVWMEYFTASRNAPSERKLDPYLLHIYRGTNPYVIGYCHKRHEMRWFRIDRIRSLKVLDEKFIQDPNFDARGHLSMIFQHEVGGVPQLVEIWFDRVTAPFIRERRWHPSQELSEHGDGSLTLQMYVSGLNDIKRWVLGYGKGAVVKNPPELVEMVQREIEAMNCNYLAND
ncbi:helix-turn-helix type 11 domain protein [Stanieria cyanosphaera PCC 7437]|uniref:Helix-turn-helix type 11 domain protein n=1 Tax=Stanieria cyanosphaera (strain ATCC 29371 / PCC 7437) TaxID=111780 RepID=K9XX30_STAC7|nr:WYL domain-containing protein [Stanieria cyanosphaera]AFZ36232.1 helix-turn-helix type 11 domain protein [Stanieria cyanosphaera PCC 7437]